MTKLIKPKQVRRYEDLVKLKRDNVSSTNSWILFNSANEIVICNQRSGETPAGRVFLTKREFKRFIDWWENG